MSLVFFAGVRYQGGMPNETIDQLARRLAESVPDGIRSLGEDLEKNFRAVLRSSLSKLDLVTREEFEVQEAVLLRTRQMLEAMEARLADLERGLVAAPKKAAKKPAGKKKPANKKAAKKATKKKAGKKKT